MKGTRSQADRLGSGHGMGGRWRVGAACVALLAGHAQAAGSLGRLDGTPVLGRPLQLSLPATLDPTDTTPCVQAALQQGDGAPTLVSSRIDAGTEGRVLLRLSSSQRVEEPVLTVRVSIGCRDPLTRSYVLLAEPPSAAREAALAGVVRTEPAPPPATVPVPPAPPIAAVAPAPAPAREAKVARSQRPAKAERPHRAAPPAPAPAPAPARARLTLDLLDLELDQAPALKMATELAKPQGEGTLSRGEAGLAWQAQNTTPEQLAALTRLVQSNEAELRRLREMSQRQADQLARVSSERDLVRGLLAAVAVLLVLGLAGFGWQRWRQRRRQGPWWDARPSRRGLERTTRGQDVHSGWTESQAPALAEAEAEAEPQPASAFGASAFGRGRLARAEELIDIHDKANFFLAVGQPDQAIALLESRLADHLDSPFLWLDLLDLCRRLNRPDDYERVRHGFRKTFSARLPAFDDTQADSGGLESYPRALSRIVLLWSSPRVLKEIEAALFEDPAPGSIPFDLEASRELLLLYSIASQVLHDQDEDDSYEATMKAPLHGPDGGTTEPVPLMALDAEPAAPAGPAPLDLDLDFAWLDKEVAAPMVLDLDLTQPARLR